MFPLWNFRLTGKTIKPEIDEEHTAAKTKWQLLLVDSKYLTFAGWLAFQPCCRQVWRLGIKSARVWRIPNRRVSTFSLMTWCDNAGGLWGSQAATEVNRKGGLQLTTFTPHVFVWAEKSSLAMNYGSCSGRAHLGCRKGKVSHLSAGQCSWSLPCVQPGKMLPRMCKLKFWLHPTLIWITAGLTSCHFAVYWKDVAKSNSSLGKGSFVG